MSVLNSDGHWPGNKLSLEELTQIEVKAERSKTPEAETILRLAAALREAMQVSEGAFACMTAARNATKRRTDKAKKTADRRREILEESTTV